MVSTVICDGQNSFDIHDTEGWEFSKQITQAFYLELFTLPCALVRWLQEHRLPFLSNTGQQCSVKAITQGRYYNINAT